MDGQVFDIGYQTPHLPLIMVVDDEPALQSLVSDTLCDYYRLVQAYNGREAIAKAEKLLPKLIMMDILMPDIGGYEAVQMLNSNNKTKTIPVIMMSANDFDPSTIAMIKRESNVKGFLMKPFRPKQLRELVQKFVPSQ